ncbi:hypothetical protein BH20GEM2_BH20GEM2_05800 [soil metagenome]
MKESNFAAPEALLPVPNPAVIFRALPDGAVLFHSDEEVYFGLNPVGARVWESLPPARRSLDELTDALHKEYPEVDRKELQSDVVELLDRLRTEHLVLPSSEEVTADAP